MERPILFSAPMVRAILDGRKTQTRRVVKPQPSEAWCVPPVYVEDGRWASNGAVSDLRCPYGRRGDTLWVREGWRPIWDHECGVPILGDCIQYREDGSKRKPEFATEEAGHRFSEQCDANDHCPRWRSPLYMPRWASRITLLVKSVRVERLQSITEADAIAEGFCESFDSAGACHERTTAKDNFARLWDSINAKKHPWASNPWVFVVDFERVVG